MIIDKLKNYPTYLSLNPRFERAFNFLINTDFSKLSDGKHIILGDQIFALMQSYTTKNDNEQRYEAHKKYIDIQFMIKGCESFYHADLTESTVNEPYNNINDVSFFEANGTRYNVKENQFYILFPHDVHKPSLHYNGKPQNVKKVVIKVLID